MALATLAKTTKKIGLIREIPVSFGSHGINLNGKLFIPGTASEKNKVPAAVMCHGYGNALSYFEETARDMAEKGIVTFIFDFRGHGDSEGVLDENLVHDVLDAWQFVHDRPEVDVKRIGLIGHSMGAFNAVVAAGKVAKPAALLTLNCPGEINYRLLQNPHNIFYRLLKRVAGFFWNISTLLCGLKVRVNYHKFIDSFPGTKISESLAELNDCSKLFVFCFNDKITPYHRFRYAFSQASEPKQVIMTTGDHNTPMDNTVLRAQWTSWMVSNLNRKLDF